jgi:hypothetical protein
MARNDSRRFNPRFADRAAPRSSAAASWQSFANLMVASTLVVAVVVSAMALFEAVVSPATSKLARRFPDPGLQNRQVGVHRTFDAPNAATPPKAVLFVDD